MQPALKLTPLLTLFVPFRAVAKTRAISSIGWLEAKSGIVRLAAASGFELPGAIIKSL